jgi:hypothetical protein
MKKFSTPLQNQMSTSATLATQTVCGPKKQTIAFLRQFARVYQPIHSMPGIVLN